MLSKFYNYNLTFFTNYIFIILLSLHIFFWAPFGYKIIIEDINFLNPKIGIFFIFLYYLIYNYKSFLKNNLNIIIIFIFLLIHLLINFDENFFIKKKLLQFLMIFSIFSICNNYYNFIIKNLKQVIFFFIIIFLCSLIFDFIVGDFFNKLKERKLLTYLFIFSENSHIAIAIVPVIFYLIFNNRQFSYSSLLGLVIAFLSLFLFYSTTLIGGIFLMILFSFIFCFNIFLKRLALIVILIALCISALWVSKNYNINERNIVNDKKLIAILHFNEQLKSYKKDVQLTEDSEDIIVHSTDCKESISFENYLHKWKYQKKHIRDFFIENYTCLPTRTSKSYLDHMVNSNQDITIYVLTNAAEVAHLSILEKFYGYGINNYESGFAKQMLSNIIPVYREVYILNYNDAASNLFKLITEFGIFSIFFFYILLKFALSDKISIQNKLFFISIIIVQLGRGVGYINGGFAFSFAIMFAHFCQNTNIYYFKKNS
jgi:hypothetical protein